MNTFVWIACGGGDGVVVVDVGGGDSRPSER